MYPENQNQPVTPQVPQTFPQPMPETPPTPPSPTPPVMHEIPRSRGGVVMTIVTVLIIIILALIGYWVYLKNYSTSSQQAQVATGTPIPTQTPSPDPTLDWQTFTDPVNKFSLKYPSGVNVDKSPARPSNQFSSVKFTYIGQSQLSTGRTQTSLTDGYQITVQTGPKAVDYDITTAAKKDRQSLLDSVSSPNCQATPVTAGTFEGLTTAEYTQTNCLGNARVIFVTRGAFVYTISGLYTNEQYLENVNLILSTFKFIDQAVTTPTPASAKVLKYSVPTGWSIASNSLSTFESAYDPKTTKIDTNSPTNGINFLRQRTDPSLGYYSCEQISLNPYDGGSQYEFIYKYLGFTPTSSSKWPDYKEYQYTYNGKSCLFLNGISYSQFNSVWGTCDAGEGKAFLITSCDRNPSSYEAVIQTIKLK